ncbi:MAG: glycosyltransferase family 1 protein [Chitinophagaceae bacterium]|nr:MAG: glycosyltransferase family 1 protein [Chitinophagaceae bacterium]
MKIKVLIVSPNPWRDDNSFGNSFDSIFNGMDEVEIHNIYCSIGIPNSRIPKSFLQINEKFLIKNILNKDYPTSRNVNITDISDIILREAKKDSHVFSFFQKNRWTVFFWMRELIWRFGRWKSEELDNYVKQVKPDIIFLPIYIFPYTNRIGLHISKRYNIKLLGYISDDNYTLKQFSLNPLFWFNRLIFRSYVKRAILRSEILYVISEEQKRDYDKIFKINTKILYKGFDISQINKSDYVGEKDTYKILYTGNLVAGREMSLLRFSKIIEEFNSIAVKKFIVNVYSKTSLKKSLLCKYQKLNSLHMKGNIPYNQVITEQLNADLLLHLESFDPKNRLLVRQSFSTKIVDYLFRSKCILAFGHESIFSIKFFREHEIGFSISTKKQLINTLNLIESDNEVLDEMGRKAACYASQNCNIEKIQQGLINDMKGVVDHAMPHVENQTRANYF